MLERYHIRRGTRRTTITLDRMLADYLALHLKEEPGTVAARTAIRAFLQAELDRDYDKHLKHVSAFLADRVLHAIVRPSLVEQWFDWFDRTKGKRGADRNVSRRRRS
jgi:hypothetical protein